MQRLAPLAIPFFLAAIAPALSGQAQEEAPALETRVWLDRGEEPVLQRGDHVRVYYRTSADVFAAILRIDTDGVVSLIFPQHPGASAPVRGGRDYRLLFPHTPVWPVEDDPGVGYFFMIASPEPLDFSAFGYDADRGWDLSAVGNVVYEDPYVAIDDYVAELVPNWETVPYALDFLTYHVGSTYSYPRFLCYDCHAQQSYTAWNPYTHACTSFRVVIWDDPYFYPAYRYSGTRVVVARPPRALPRYGVVTRAPGDGVLPLVRQRDAPARRAVQYKEPTASAPQRVVPLRRSSLTSPAAQQRPGASRGGAQVPDSAAGRPTLQPRSATPSGRLPVRTPPDATAPRQPIRGATPPGPTREESPRVGRPDPRGPQTTPSRPTTRPVPSRAAPSRPSSAPARPSSPTRSGVGTRPATPSRPSARPAAPSRGGAGPSRPAPSRPSARPSSPPPSRPSARPSPAPRAPAPRPTVQPRRPGRGN